MSGTKSVLAVSSTSFLLGVGESLEMIAVAVSICKLFCWEMSIPVSRGRVKGIVTEDFYLGIQCLVTYCCSINVKGNHLFEENVEKTVECKYFGYVV